MSKPSPIAAAMPTHEELTSENRRGAWVTASVLGLVAALLYFFSRGTGLTDWDSIQFAWGVEEFNLFTHRPHPPGYPLYIWSARLLWRFTPLDIEGAMIAIAALGGGLFLGCWWWIFNRQFGARFAWPASIALAVMPLTLLTANKALTDAPAAGLMALTLALALAHRDRPHPWRLASAGGVAALATGFRPQNVIFNLLMVVIGGWRRAKCRAWLAAIAGFALLGLAWLIPLLASQAHTPEGGGDWLAWPRQLWDQFSWRFDKPNNFVGAGAVSMDYLTERLFKHGPRSLIYYGLGWDPKRWLGVVGLVFGAIGAAGYLFSRPWRHADQRRFWLAHLPWALLYWLMVFALLPPDARYFIPLAPLLVFPLVAGWMHIGDWLGSKFLRSHSGVTLGWAVPLLLVVTTAPVAWEAHRDPPPPVAMIQELERLHPPEERSDVWLIAESSLRHAQFYGDEFHVVERGTNPIDIPEIADALAVYTDRRNLAREEGWEEWRQERIDSFHCSRVIQTKHARVILYRITLREAR